MNYLSYLELLHPFRFTVLLPPWPEYNYWWLCRCGWLLGRKTWHCCACIWGRTFNSNGLVDPGLFPRPLWVHWRRLLLGRRLWSLCRLLLWLRILVRGWFYRALLGHPERCGLFGGRWQASRSPSQAMFWVSRQGQWVMWRRSGHLPWLLLILQWRTPPFDESTHCPGLRWRCVQRHRGHPSRFGSRGATPCGRWQTLFEMGERFVSHRLIVPLPTISSENSCVEHKVVGVFQKNCFIKIT